MILYDIRNGNIICRLSDDQDIDVYFQFYPRDFVKYLNFIPDTYTRVLELKNYKVENKTLVTRSDLEIEELYMYNRTLTEEERLLNKLKPSHEEVRKAENTIEILTLIQEVI